MYEHLQVQEFTSVLPHAHTTETVPPLTKNTEWRREHEEPAATIEEEHTEDMRERLRKDAEFRSVLEAAKKQRKQETEQEGQDDDAGAGGQTCLERIASLATEDEEMLTLDDNIKELDENG